MELDWSEQSPQIRTVFRSWQPGDGYDEATLQAAEARLGLRLPTTLRNFYLAWGRRRELLYGGPHLLSPDELVLQSQRLIFVREDGSVDQGEVQIEPEEETNVTIVVKVLSGVGVPFQALGETDPPVVVSFSGTVGWTLPAELSWTQSHVHLSGFLDEVTYQGALIGGAIHGGWAELDAPGPPAHQTAWLEDHWGKAVVSPWMFGAVAPNIIVVDHEWPTLYVRDGQALSWGIISALWRLERLRLLTKSANSFRSRGHTAGELEQ